MVHKRMHRKSTGPIAPTGEVLTEHSPQEKKAGLPKRQIIMYTHVRVGKYLPRECRAKGNR